MLPEMAAGCRPIVFAHSYSAAGIFVEAKRRGWTTVLGQIDPGPEHFVTQDRLAAVRREFGPAPPAPPPEYFEAWRKECDFADWIVVNSDWSRESLLRAGVGERKLKTIPLPYEPDSGATVDREYPAVRRTGRCACYSLAPRLSQRALPICWSHSMDWATRP